MCIRKCDFFLFALPLSAPVPLLYWRKDRTFVQVPKHQTTTSIWISWHLWAQDGTSTVLYNVGTATHLGFKIVQAANAHAVNGETSWTTLSICAVYLHSPTQTEHEKSRDFEHVRREKLKDSTEEDTAVGFIIIKRYYNSSLLHYLLEFQVFFCLSILRGYLKRLSPSTEVRNLLLRSMRLPKLVSLDLNDFLRLHLLTCSQFRLQSGDLLFTKAQKCGAGEWRLGQDKDPYELISASKKISYKLLSVIVGGSTNDRKFFCFYASSCF